MSLTKSPDVHPVGLLGKFAVIVMAALPSKLTPFIALGVAKTVADPASPPVDILPLSAVCRSVWSDSVPVMLPHATEPEISTHEELAHPYKELFDVRIYKS
jgi:hypothetical protein